VEIHLYVRDVPDDLHRRARVAAARRGESIRALVLRALEAECARLDAEEREGR
jgi:plasmid stability protein